MTFLLNTTIIRLPNYFLLMKKTNALSIFRINYILFYTFIIDKTDKQYTRMYMYLMFHLKLSLGRNQLSIFFSIQNNK